MHSQSILGLQNTPNFKQFPLCARNYVLELRGVVVLARLEPPTPFATKVA